MKKALHWFTHNVSGIAVLFFLAFIPLYPKLPIINVIRTWVYIRLEDFFVAIAITAYIFVKLRTRALPKTPLTWPIILYWCIGILSSIFSIVYIGPTLVGYFPHLVALHFFRRIEYMMLFFMAYDIVSRKRYLVPYIIWTLAITTFLVVLYGLGQKFFGLPAFLTMNEEFAKGIPLRLPPTARIPSTFGGHYDLAAYIVLILPILVTAIFAAKKIWQKCMLFLISIGALVMLLFTQSRTSFLVYVAGISFTLLWYKKKWLILPVILVSFLLLSFVSGTSERFYKTFRYNDVIIDLSTGKPVGTLASLEGTSAVVQKSESPAVENLPTGSQYIALPQPSTTKETKQVKTVTFYDSVDLSTASGEIATISGSFLIQKAFVYDISITTRLQGEWPMAIAAFKRNILLGSGFSTLSVASDGDYVRMLGETGILGSLSFLGIILAAFTIFFKKKDTVDGYSKALVVGVFGGLTGLLFNAILIDVFEASKVAFTFWLLLGIALALLSSAQLSLTAYITLLKKTLTHNIAFVLYLFIVVIVFYGRSISNYFVADDFTWIKWAANTPFSGLLSYFTNAQGFFYRPIPKLWYFVLYSIFWLKPEGYHVMSYILLGVSAFEVYLLMMYLGVKRSIALLCSILFASLSIHHENVFWISGQSSLLSAVFLFGSIIAVFTSERYKKYRKTAYRIFSVLLLVLAMFSYDGMIIAPLIYSVVLWFIVGKKQWSSLLPIVAIPMYWIIRTFSGAVPPSGDYGYKLHTLPYNVIGNSIGYILSSFLGPRIVESWGTLREFLRVQRIVAGGLGIIITIGCILVVRRVRKSLQMYRDALIWFLCGVIAILAYIGLGNISERYVFIASGFFIIACGSAISKIWDLHGHVVSKSLTILSILGLIVWNSTEIKRLSGDWEKASTVSEKSLVTINKLFFPLKENKSFYFVNTPIRYGRAWIFPTGLTDPFWHIFHFNQFGYTTTNVSSPKEADDTPIISGFAPEILTFDNFNMKRVVRHITTVNSDN